MSHLVEQVMGIEPTRPAWEAGVLPLNYTCRGSHPAGPKKWPAAAQYDTNVTILIQRFGFVNTLALIFPLFSATFLAREALRSSPGTPLPRKKSVS